MQSSENDNFMCKNAFLLISGFERVRKALKERRFDVEMQRVISTSRKEDDLPPPPPPSPSLGYPSSPAPLPPPPPPMSELELSTKSCVNSISATLPSNNVRSEVKSEGGIGLTPSNLALAKSRLIKVKRDPL